MNDLLIANKTDFLNISYVLLNEIDRMLSMGYESDVCRILDHLRSDRQTVITTTNWSAQMNPIVKKYMIQPLQINVGAMDMRIAETVRQEIQIVHEDDKFNKVYLLLSVHFTFYNLCSIVRFSCWT